MTRKSKEELSKQLTEMHKVLIDHSLNAGGDVLSVMDVNFPVTDGTQRRHLMVGVILPVDEAAAFYDLILVQVTMLKEIVKYKYTNKDYQPDPLYYEDDEDSNQN